MSDVVPPGGDRPIDLEPWPGSGQTAAPVSAELPGVPSHVPAGVEAPPDWQTMGDRSAPAGYQAPGGRPIHPSSRVDRWGISSCVVAGFGVAQVVPVHVPLLSVAACLLALAGIRFDRLDPTPRPVGWRGTTPSMAGLAVGIAGCVLGLGLWWSNGDIGSVTLF